MSLESVRAFFAEKAPDVELLVTEASTATVALAAEVHGVEPGQIAKTLSLSLNDQPILIVARGDARLDNKKYRARFGAKAKMLDAEAALAATSHPVGGICPFGLPEGVTVYCDVSLKAFAEVVPAAGAPNAAVRIGTERMADLVGAEWVDVCQEPQAA
ncbi:YbaK/EbsC family protein [Neomegalonema perideroedes]|uniref:YbaK/EbsC family protein n=1 Tax=Neomegalonema perideroedes TaxID=217219 RepID=UPI00036D3C38|nr:YbaK/EbsC family protein [Neomegalonema perideroedes]